MWRSSELDASPCGAVSRVGTAREVALLAGQDRRRPTAAPLPQRNWSPQQIAAWLRLNHPEDEAFCVSHETIYRSPFVQSLGVLKKATNRRHNDFKSVLRRPVETTADS